MGNARRTPKQARSQQRVDHLLTTAAAVFGEVGLAEATTNQIAARAGMSIGSLYQFFPNKEAIWAALIERYAFQLRGLLSAEGMADRPFREVIQTIITRLLAFDTEHAGFKALFITGPTAEQINAEIVNQICDLFRTRFPALSEEIALPTALVAVSLVRGMLTLRSDPHPAAPPLPSLVGEITAALLGYLRTVLLRHGVTIPADIEAV
ncbi:MAG TPA: TetR/AcrR family transcriptional regulator [Aggregatilineales bacterium]|nr:TetR/AcrR family transcriptional regulator [Anaerolineales bacterium]HRE49476.1 TetR/AcrR family transcriptional regulator [Aggregatilineales bacterium]